MRAKRDGHHVYVDDNVDAVFDLAFCRLYGSAGVANNLVRAGYSPAEAHRIADEVILVSRQD